MVDKNNFSYIEKTTNSLTEYANNSRTHSAAQIKQVAASIKEFGFTNPILIDENNIIIAGHCRLAAAKQLKMKIVPCIVMAGLTDEQKAAYVIADNKLALNAGWDDEMLRVEFEKLDAAGYDTSITGFTLQEIKGITICPPGGGKTDDDAIPSMPKKRTSREGDIWLLGNHRVMCGDSTDAGSLSLLMQNELADMVFTDPPYGIDYSGGRTQVVAVKEHGKIKNDNLEGDDLGNPISQLFSFHKTEADIYVCVSPIMQKPFLDIIDDRGYNLDSVIVWDKKQPGLGYMAYRRQCEFILFIKGKPFKRGDKSDFDLWSISRDNGQDYVHGTQKPVAVPQRGIENSSKKGDLVLDLFLGSGSTLIAAQKTGRKCYGMELDPQYVDVIVNRWQDYTGEKAIHENGRAFDDLKNERS